MNESSDLVEMAGVGIEPNTSGYDLRNSVGEQLSPPLVTPSKAFGPYDASTYFESDNKRGDAGAAAGAIATPASILSSWPVLTELSFSNALQRKLSQLASAEDGWRGPGSKQLSSDALAVFLRFWQRIANDAREPAIALTRDGFIQAQWYRSDRQHLDLIFRGDRRVMFGYFNHFRVYEGMDSAEQVAALFSRSPEKPFSW
jgi:hypothetical protein